MMKRTGTFALAALLIFAANTAAQTPAPALSDLDRRNVEVVRLFNAGKFAEALPLARDAAELARKSHGKNALALVAPLRNLAYVHMNLGNKEDAAKAFGDALDVLDANEPLDASNRQKLAEMLEAAAYFDIGEGTISKSIARLQRAIEIREKLNGPESPEVARPLQTLGQIHTARGDHEKAVPLLTRALSIQKKMPGADTLMLRRTTECALMKLGRADEAKTVSIADPPPSKSNQLMINGGVLNGKALSLMKPPYPAEARRARAAGTVKVQIIIGEKGDVLFACAVEGSPLLHQAAESAAYRSRFSPTKLDDKPVKVSGLIVYNFVP